MVASSSLPEAPVRRRQRRSAAAVEATQASHADGAPTDAEIEAEANAEAAAERARLDAEAEETFATADVAGLEAQIRALQADNLVLAEALEKAQTGTGGSRQAPAVSAGETFFTTPAAPGHLSVLVDGAGGFIAAFKVSPRGNKSFEEAADDLITTLRNGAPVLNVDGQGGKLWLGPGKFAAAKWSPDAAAVKPRERGTARTDATIVAPEAPSAPLRKRAVGTTGLDDMPEIANNPGHLLLRAHAKAAG